MLDSISDSLVAGTEIILGAGTIGAAKDIPQVLVFNSVLNKKPISKSYPISFKVPISARMVRNAQM